MSSAFLKCQVRLRRHAKWILNIEQPPVFYFYYLWQSEKFKNDNIMHTYVCNVVTEYVLFGFCVYKKLEINPLGDQIGNEIQKDHLGITVGDGFCFNFHYR